MQVEILVQIAPPYVNNVQELMINVQPVTAIMFWMETNVNQRMCVLQENIQEVQDAWIAQKNVEHV